MRYLVFGDEKRIYPVALLTRYLRERELKNYLGDVADDVVVYSITTNQKAKNTELKDYLGQLLPILCDLQTEYLLVTEASLFKVLTKITKVSTVGGYVLPCVFEGFKHLHVIYMPAPQQIIYDPSLVQKAAQGLQALKEHREDRYLPPGSDIVTFEEYPTDVARIQKWLDDLLDVPLAIDIETYGLKHYEAGIGTISLCWSKNQGIAFAVDKDNSPEKAELIRAMLKSFFIRRNARTLYHDASFDVYILVYQLFMANLLDTQGLLEGLKVMLRGVDDTKLITYLATNSCAGNHLGLKEQAQAFAGNYAVDVKDITTVPLDDLLIYNLVDGLSTWYVLEKHWDRIVADQQLDIYENIFKPALADVIQMQLTGIPINREKVLEGQAIMQADADKALAVLAQSQFVKQTEAILADKWVEKRNKELKVKRVTAADWKESFNINSGQQLQILLYEIMGLPVESTTDTGQPATGKDDIAALRHHLSDAKALEVIDAILAYKEVEKILTSFIPAFLKAPLAPDDHYYLYGFYNLGGTVSGRLSSNDPNMQNLPSTGNKYADLVKQMFQAPKGWLFVGLDFNSLEDMISALTTKDPNKLKVYTDGYDGHCLRAFSYFGDQMPDIVNTIESINSIKKKYESLRQDSKVPTFSLTYAGTWRTIQAQCGFSEEKSRQIEDRYHELYVVSDQWVADKLKQASIDGYVTVAFGLRLRTPMLSQTISGTRATPYEAIAEGRTAGNALGQSWGLLNTRAATEFMQRVRGSNYKLEIKPCAQIHDAQYYLVRDDVELLAWVNKHLVKAVQWQEHPDIQHDQVKLGGTLSVFYPSWKEGLTIPNGAAKDQILSLAMEHISQ